MGDDVMAEKLDLSDAKVQKVIVHRVGNKFRDEGIVFSDSESERSSSLNQLLLRNFLIPVVNRGDEYILTHESDIKLNPIKHYSSLVFENENEFFNSSLAVAKHLYICSSHPNIGGGEFIEILYDGIKNNGMSVQAIGLFRIENKNSYLDVRSHDGVIDIVEKEGISIDSIQKGAIILSVENAVFVDNVGKKTKYWIDSFIKATPKNTSKKYTQILGELTKSISKKINSPNDALVFSESLSCEEVLSVNQLKEISRNFINQNDVDSIVDGIGVKYGMDIDADFGIEKEKLSRYIKDTISKTKLSKGVNVVISEPNIRVLSVEVQPTNIGFRAIVDIKKGE